MPRKVREIADPMVREWAAKIKKPQTRQVYLYCFQRLLDTMHLTGKELFDMAVKDSKKTWHQLRKPADSFESQNVRKDALYGARHFLLTMDENDDIILPPTRIQQPETTKPPTYLQWEDAIKVCDGASPPYNSIFDLMLHAGWGANEFLHANKPETWQAIKANLAANPNLPYVRFSFLGRKKNTRPFYSLVSAGIINRIFALEAKAKLKLPFAGRGRNGADGTPLDIEHVNTARRYLESAFATALKHAAIVGYEGQPTLHEFRDSFITRATTVGCSDTAANFVVGHVIDKFNYNKIARNEGWIWNEIKKLYGPAAVMEDQVRRLEEKNKTLEARLQKLEAISVERLTLAKAASHKKRKKD